MGLDMYLYSRKTYTPEEAGPVLAVAGVTHAELVQRCAPDEDGYRDNLYLSAYDFQRNPRNGTVNPEVARCDAVVAAVGLTPTQHSPSVHITAQDDGTVTVDTTTAYWRKANAIHSWFVTNAQGGVDECQVSDAIDVELLAMLKTTCDKALAAYQAGNLEEAEQLLTPTDGFFFGSTSVDEWWANDVKETSEAVESVINEAIAVGGVTFHYHSSW